MKTKTSATSLKGQWGKVGAPPKTITFPRGKFTLKEIFAANKGACELTIRKRVDAYVLGFYVVNGKKITVPKAIVQLDETSKQDGVGRPNFLFRVKPGQLSTVNAPIGVKVKARRKTRKAPMAIITTPVMPVALVPAIVPDIEPNVVVSPDGVVTEGSDIPAFAEVAEAAAV